MAAAAEEEEDWEADRAASGGWGEVDVWGDEDESPPEQRVVLAPPEASLAPAEPAGEAEAAGGASGGSSAGGGDRWSQESGWGEVDGWDEEEPKGGDDV